MFNVLGSVTSHKKPWGCKFRCRLDIHIYKCRNILHPFEFSIPKLIVYTQPAQINLDKKLSKHFNSMSFYINKQREILGII